MNKNYKIYVFIITMTFVFFMYNTSYSFENTKKSTTLSSIKIPKSQRVKANFFLEQNDLVYKTDFKDRYNTTHQIALDKNGNIIQEKLLKNGLAYLIDTRSSHLENFIKSENFAIKQKKGIWSKRKIISPNETEKKIYSFQIIQGRVKQATLKKNFLYLNFGEDWRTDFTVGIPKKIIKVFKKKKVDINNLDGKKIRVRGFIEHYYGAFIKIDRFEQLQIFF